VLPCKLSSATSPLHGAIFSEIPYRQAPETAACSPIYIDVGAGFDCETHGKFKVADAVFAERRVRNCTNAQWEAALRKAKQRTKAGEWLVIKSYDF
jgi:hypothetical protein